ncbi:MAG: hypothetical protein CMJ23_11320 [Phycisphaerae bacterium]|nr:hypothetical protein [Phycisphaerae bacterium]
MDLLDASDMVMGPSQPFQAIFTGRSDAEGKASWTFQPTPAEYEWTIHSHEDGKWRLAMSQGRRSRPTERSMSSAEMPEDQSLPERDFGLIRSGCPGELFVCWPA